MRNVILFLEDEKDTLMEMGVDLSEITVDNLYDVSGNSSSIIARTGDSKLVGGLLYKLGFKSNSEVCMEYTGRKLKTNTTIKCIVNESTVIVWEDVKAPSSVGKSILQSNLAEIITAMSDIDGMNSASKSVQMELFLSLN